VLPVSSRDKPLHRRLLRASEQSERPCWIYIGVASEDGRVYYDAYEAGPHTLARSEAGRKRWEAGGAGSTDPALGGVFQMSHHDDESGSDEEASLYEVNPLSLNPLEWPVMRASMHNRSGRCRGCPVRCAVGHPRC